MAKIDKDNIMDMVKEATDKVAETVKEVTENPEVQATVKKAADTAKKAAKEVAENPQVKKAASSARKAAKDVAEQPQVKKAAKSARSAMDKANEVGMRLYSKLALKETYIQVYGQEIRESDILGKIETVWKEQGHRTSSIKSLEVYIKPEDGAAYYVINDGKFTGSVEL